MGLKNHAILLIHCNDRKGLISTITHFLFEHNGNIIDLDEHVEKSEGIFFMRVEWELEGFDIPKENIHSVFDEKIASQFEMEWQLHFTDKKPRMAIFVSKASHCLYDILSRHYSGEWQIEIPAIISNHSIHEEVANRYGIPFYHFEMNKDNKAEVEMAQMTLLTELRVDFIILARYMQILSNDFISAYPNRIINIHHSFLPAFAGAKPYHRAHERGVKIIGATSHYVTADLDAGPIIEQDVVKISHKNTVEDLIRKGKDLEKIVLSRAIWTHLQRKALVHNNRTVIFE
ncbi:formyltetrahydrofolate deformylase [Marinoscillum furvescens]|uniref:Formyltetrahydrofolate deformylase n=1 Tax=Marinoscillum furvescens DSM 4134 TaxID=1122208 RepID=A0A3D9LHF1_MARFU|nr:formyltetrahydrofolate deformylase [Marinoscillum furvescens]REE05934.1 formyltetrahydrofolate deformylase [Marinoscillum furvescens DSM 4134]